MKKITLILTLFSIILMFSCKQEEIEVNYAFPQHAEYFGNYITPSNYSQEELDNITSDFYDKWKNKYVKSNCEENQYYIDYDEGNTINVSEGLGYGMMITVIMAGYDNDAKSLFDGMYRFYKAHPSSINPSLMAWEQVEGCINNPDGGDDAASDGDIDIAYSLLLAHKQWDSDGEINYLAEAKKIINAILEDEINHQTWTVKLGDWSDSSELNYFFSTRASDFINDHFRAFQTATSNSDWTKVIDTCYSLINFMQTNYSQTTGLIPDFIINVNTTPSPAGPDFLESEYDGDFSYNSCRVPWRITTDYLISGDLRAKNYIDKINNWLIENSGGNPDNIFAGYFLNGEPIVDYNDLVFTGAFAVSAMLSENQEWLNLLFESVINENINDNGYFGNTLKMLYLITISKNYWFYDFLNY